MRVHAGLLTVSLSLVMTGCAGGGTSTREMEAAAIERARQELSLPAGTPLQATVWAGREYEGEPALCGTVSSEGGSASVSPQRFMATPDPVQFLVWEDAHSPMRSAQPGKFPAWQSYCAQREAMPA